MSQATGRVGGIKLFGAGVEAIPAAATYGLASGVADFRDWLMGLNSSGLAVAQAAGVTGLISGGFADRDNAAANPAAASGALTMLRQQFVSGFPNSTGTLDAILAADIGVPVYAADNQTVGKLSNYAAVNRSLLGLAFGIDTDNGTPIIYVGPVAWLLARSAMANDSALFGQHSYLVDAGAATDLTEIQFSAARAKLHGTIQSIDFTANATLAATGATDFKTLTVTKYAADGTTPVVVGTMTTVAATTKWVAKAFTLSAVAGALDILEGDTFTIKNTHGGSGAVTPAGVIRINGKVM